MEKEVWTLTKNIDFKFLREKLNLIWKLLPPSTSMIIRTPLTRTKSKTTRPRLMTVHHHHYITIIFLFSREHFHCLDCNSRVFVKKEEMIRHFKWHKKRDESLQHGFMRYSPSDDCSDRYQGCSHNRKQTHYHCIQVITCSRVVYLIIQDNHDSCSIKSKRIERKMDFFQTFFRFTGHMW